MKQVMKKMIKKKGQWITNPVLRDLLRHLWREVQEPEIVQPADREALNFMHSASAAMIEQSPRGGRLVLWIIGIFFFSALVWSAFSSVDEYTRGYGRVIPSSHIQVIQNLEGGILDELYVSEGDVVENGQALLRIDDTQFASSEREQKRKLDQLFLQIQRLKTEAVGKEFIPDLQGRDIAPDVVEMEQQLFRSRQEQLASNNSTIEQQVRQRKQELDELESAINKLARSYALVSQELTMTRPLLADGAISKVEVLRLERQASELQGDLEHAKLSRPRLAASLSEVEDKKASLTLEFRNKSQEELNLAAGEYSRLMETQGALKDRVERAIVRAPMKGQIKQLMIKTIGGVIRPGMDIVEIVPGGESLLIEARVQPADIAFLHPDEKAVVKVAAYDFTIHGGLDGKLVHISPDTITDEKGDSYYIVRVQTDKNYLGTLANPMPIIPGMTVEIEVLTGKKTILQYLLKPVTRARARALTER